MFNVKNVIFCNFLRFLKNLNQTFDEIEQRVHGIRIVREDIELYITQLDQLMSREQRYVETQKRYHKGDTNSTLRCTMLKDDEGHAYYMSDMNTTKMIIKRAFSFISKSKRFLALNVVIKYMDDEVKVGIAIKTMIYHWIRRGRWGVNDVWLKSAILIEEE